MRLDGIAYPECIFNNLLDACWGGVVEVEIWEVDTKIELYVDGFWLGF